MQNSLDYKMLNSSLNYAWYVLLVLPRANRASYSLYRPSLYSQAFVHEPSLGEAQPPLRKLAQYINDSFIKLHIPCSAFQFHPRRSC